MYPRSQTRVAISLFGILAIVLAVIGLFFVDIWLIILLSLILFLPGYALTSAIFPIGMLNISEHITMALGISISITVFIGLIIFWLRINLNSFSWVVMLGGLVIIAGVVAIVRRREYIQLTIFSDGFEIRIIDILLFCLAALLITGAIILSQRGAIQQPFNEFTQLWITPTDLGEQIAVQLGIHNQENEKTSYRLELKSGDQLLALWDSIALEPGEIWSTTELLPMEINDQMIEARMYRLDNPDIQYRYVQLRGNFGKE